MSNRHFRHGLNLIKKAMAITSRATKGITISIIIITIGGLASSFWFSWAGIVPLFASIGGMVVFLGLWIEQEADDQEKGEHLSNFVENVRDMKFMHRFGWWFLMLGIVVEIFSAAGLTIWDEYKEVKNNPLNQPISTFSASVEIVVKGRQNIELTSYTNGLPHAASLFLCSDVIRWKDVLFWTNSPPNSGFNLWLGPGDVTSVVSITRSNVIFKFVNASGIPRWEPKKIPGFPSLDADRYFVTKSWDKMTFGFNGLRSPNGENMQFRELPGAPGGYQDSHKYDLQFHPAVASDLDIPVGKKAKSINEIKAILIVLNFLPHDSEILGGVVRVDINNFKKIFVIPPQTNAPLEIFEIVTTNVLTTFN